jgi:ribosomal protein S2
MKKQLITFSLNQLLECNLHLGNDITNWTSISNQIVLGYRLNNFILNINLGIINLKKSFLLIETLSFQRLTPILFFLEHKAFITNLLFYSKYLKRLNCNYLLVKYLAGIVTNFKTYRINLYPKLLKFFDIFNIDIFIKIFYLNVNIFRLLGLLNYASVPSILISLTANEFFSNEARRVNIPVVQIFNSDVDEQLINKTTYLIPFNLNSTMSSILLFNLFLNSIFIGFLKTRKLFFKLLIYVLKYYKSMFVAINYKQIINLNFTFFINFYRLIKNLKFKNKKVLNKKNLLLNKFFLFSTFT